ncbi:hypothetical protein ABL78_1478 [Leptomonas seymouri]|uniref:Uncharacterized protein n=1 Tax=Leptomonas seymouri TaxID=5684 RepID=A0A0N1IMB8_LEPSE|nr:hypothetical protein ABL78_1478 [Leptomonas seymouri]|eukprot:KPI89442.1 hypothetical protein ABL78_1478 [Leptomonas seymouri]
MGCLTAEGRALFFASNQSSDAADVHTAASVIPSLADPLSFGMVAFWDAELAPLKVQCNCSEVFTPSVVVLDSFMCLQPQDVPFVRARALVK